MRNKEDDVYPFSTIFLDTDDILFNGVAVVILHIPRRLLILSAVSEEQNHRGYISQTVAVEDQLSMVEAEFRAALAEVWEGKRPSVMGLAKLERARLRLGLSLSRAQDLEHQIRVELAQEVFDNLEPDWFAQFLPKGADVNITGWHGKIVEFYQNLGRAIRIDSDTSIELFLEFLPDTVQLSYDAFCDALMHYNRARPKSAEYEHFKHFLTQLKISLIQRPESADRHEQ